MLLRLSEAQPRTRLERSDSTIFLAHSAFPRIRLIFVELALLLPRTYLRPRCAPEVLHAQKISDSPSDAVQNSCPLSLVGPRRCRKRLEIRGYEKRRPGIRARRQFACAPRRR